MLTAVVVGLAVMVVTATQGPMVGMLTIGSVALSYFAGHHSGRQHREWGRLPPRSARRHDQDTVDLGWADSVPLDNPPVRVQ